MKGHMQDGKFHPHTEHKKGVRKSRDQQVKTEGVKIRNARDPKIQGKIDLDQFFFIVKTLQKEGIAKEGMTSQELVDIYNKRTGSTAKLGNRSGDINKEYRVFKHDKNRIIDNQARYARDSEPTSFVEVHESGLRNFYDTKWRFHEGIGLDKQKKWNELSPERKNGIATIYKNKVVEAYGKEDNGKALPTDSEGLEIPKAEWYVSFKDTFGSRDNRKVIVPASSLSEVRIIQDNLEATKEVSRSIKNISDSQNLPSLKDKEISLWDKISSPHLYVSGHQRASNLHDRRENELKDHVSEASNEELEKLFKKAGVKRTQGDSSDPNRFFHFEMDHKQKDKVLDAFLTGD